VIWLLLIPATWVAAALALDAHGRRAVPAGQWDAIIVPGCKVRKDGHPSAALARRVRHAVALWKEGRAPTLVMTGGIGTHPPAEAVVAADLARSLGVPEASILIEDASTTTRHNAAFAAALIHEGTPISRWQVLVVSDAYHAWRCGRLFSTHFAEAVGRGSVPGWRLRIRGSLREVVSIVLGAFRAPY
jgi:uncharacterized SAM-binding protein YcdF (DUF218 family)